MHLESMDSKTKHLMEILLIISSHGKTAKETRNAKKKFVQSTKLLLVILKKPKSEVSHSIQIVVLTWIPKSKVSTLL
ncbi:hypothetical protein L1887_23500 [Cichorium endivia]|nr:hypothetical protein L1887_23500 [Cichorium endivia]